MIEGFCCFCNISIKKSSIYCSKKCQWSSKRKNLVDSGKASIKTIRRYLLENFEYCCSECNVGSEWNGKSLTLQMDHIDGCNSNNSIDNVRWLCPNCHTQTQTWGVNNASDEGKVKLSTGGRPRNSVNINL